MIGSADKQPTRAAICAKRLPRSSESDFPYRHAVKVSDNVFAVPTHSKMSPLPRSRTAVAEITDHITVSSPNVAKKIVASGLAPPAEAKEKRMSSSVAVGQNVPRVRIRARH